MLYFTDNYRCKPITSVSMLHSNVLMNKCIFIIKPVFNQVSPIGIVKSLFRGSPTLDSRTKVFQTTYRQKKSKTYKAYKQHLLYACIHVYIHKSTRIYSPFIAALHLSSPSSVPPMSQECGNDCLNFIKRTASFGSIFTNTIKKKQL